MSLFSANSTLAQIFNWKKHPSGVFFPMIPLALIGFFCMGALAFFQWKLHGKWGYGVIFAFGMGLLWLALQPALRMSGTLQKMEEDLVATRSKQPKSSASPSSCA